MCPPAESGQQEFLGRSIDPYSASFELPYRKGALAASPFKQAMTTGGVPKSVREHSHLGYLGHQTNFDNRAVSAHLLIGEVTGAV